MVGSLSSTAPVPGANAGASVTSTSRRGEPAPLGVLAQKLLVKMKDRFGDAATDNKGREIIRREVTVFMRKAEALGKMQQEEDLVELEGRIQAKLTGSAPRKMTLAMEKRAQAEGDEWSKIFQFSIQKGHLQETAELEAKRMRQARQRKILDGQLQEKEHIKKSEQEQERLYADSEKNSLREWEQKENLRKQGLANTARIIGQQRLDQLREKEARRQKAIDKVKQDESDITARVMYDTLQEMEREEQDRHRQKESLQKFLLSNEVNKQMKEEAKRKQLEEDQLYKKLWEEKLNKQEAQRLALLNKNKMKQDLQAAAAAGRPECKRWIDQDIIDRHFHECEAAKDREDRERREKVKAEGKRTEQRLKEQMKELEEAKKSQKEADMEAHRMIMARVAIEEQKELRLAHRREEAKHKFKDDIEEQMKDRAERRRIAPMTDVERLINKNLLNQISEWKATGKIPL